MSNWGENYDDDAQSNGNNDGAGEGLRSYIKNLEAQNKDLNTKLTSFLEDQQKQKMNVVFESLGVPGAATVYQGEADPEAAKAWVQSMQSVFGTAQVAHATGSSEPVQPVISDDVQQQFQTFNQAGNSGEPVGKYEAARGEISGKSPDEILAFMNQFGGGQ
jgi:hypothetical protein